MGDAKGSRSILAALPTDLSTRLFAGARPHRVAAGEPLFHAGDPPDGCYRLETGLLKLSVDSQDGERLVIGFLGEGAMVGPRVGFSELTLGQIFLNWQKS